MQHFHGFLPLYKPVGITSRVFANKVQSLLGNLRLGFAGTLDPFASGVLVASVNYGGQAIQFLKNSKSYDAQFKFNLASPTVDLESDSVKVFPDNGDVDRETAASFLSSYLGDQVQIPPAASALKFEGAPLYKLQSKLSAEEMNTILGEKRRVRRIDSMKVNGWCSNEECNFPEVNFSMKAVTGTYVRSIAESMSKKLDRPALMSALVRTESNGYSLSEAVSYEDILKLNIEDRLKLFRPIDEKLDHLPAVILRGNKRSDDITAIYSNKSMNFSTHPTGKILRPSTYFHSVVSLNNAIAMWMKKGHLTSVVCASSNNKIADNIFSPSNPGIVRPEEQLEYSPTTSVRVYVLAPKSVYDGSICHFPSTAAPSLPKLEEDLEYRFVGFATTSNPSVVPGEVVNLTPISKSMKFMDLDRFSRTSYA